MAGRHPAEDVARFMDDVYVGAFNMNTVNAKFTATPAETELEQPQGSYLGHSNNAYEPGVQKGKQATTEL